MEPLTVEELVDWSHSEYGGLIVRFSPASFKTVCYFLREFGIPTKDPDKLLGAFRSGDFLIVGTSAFRDQVCRTFRLAR